MELKRLEQQIKFIIEIDKLKSIFRQTLIVNKSRNENDAEHSWHLAVMALVLSEYSKEKDIDMLKVFKMCLIHDLVEIDAGDTFAYDVKHNLDKKEREEKAAERIFNILPQEQAKEIMELWIEFDEMQTGEASFAASLDRLQPLMHNYLTEGAAWKKHGVTSDKVIERNNHIKNGAPLLWEFALKLIEESVQKGYLEK